MNTLPTDPKERKDIPIVTGVLDYFPDAIAEVARVSKAGNDQHNPGQPLHWAKGKSQDHEDCIGRHTIERGTRDTDGQRHSAKRAWRALAALQTEIEAEREGLTVEEYNKRLRDAEAKPTDVGVVAFIPYPRPRNRQATAEEHARTGIRWWCAGECLDCDHHWAKR